jgi:hypothetical protein
MKARRILTVVLVLAGVALYFGANAKIAGDQKRTSVSTYNKKAGGVSIFADLKNEMSRDSVKVRRSPILYSADLQGVASLLVLSPTTEISRHEANQIATYVDGGGFLVLSLHDKISEARVRHLLEELGAGVTVFEEPRFRNGQSILVSPKADFSFFKASETYELYSPVILERNECRGGGFECYAYEMTKGKGKALILAGLPFFGNVLIGRQANRVAALRLAGEFPSFQIDEYHHLFSDKTLFDLVRKPEFSLPILGSILAAILLFAFGHSPFHERSLQAVGDEKPARTLHGLSESMVYRVFESPRAFGAILAQHRDFLARVYPGRLKELAPGASIGAHEKEFLTEGRRLLRLHKRWAEIRGDRR